MDTAPLPPPKPPRKRPVVLIVGAVAGGLALVLCLCGIGSAIGLNARDGADKKRTPAATPATPSESLPPSGALTSRSPSATQGAPVPKVAVPNVVGKRLTDAQAQLKALGFTKITAADATGQGRVVLNANNWLVRSQLPSAGSTVPVDARLTLNVTKPSDGQQAGPVTVGVVPNVVCQDLQAAQ